MKYSWIYSIYFIAKMIYYILFKYIIIIFILYNKYNIKINTYIYLYRERYFLTLLFHVKFYFRMSLFMTVVLSLLTHLQW